MSWSIWKIFPTKKWTNWKSNSKNSDKKPSETAQTCATLCPRKHADPSGSDGFWFSRDASPQKNFPTRAKAKHFAVGAIRFTRVTTTTPVPDQPVAPNGPIFFWHEVH